MAAFDELFVRPALLRPATTRFHHAEALGTLRFLTGEQGEVSRPLRLRSLRTLRTHGRRGPRSPSLQQFAAGGPRIAAAGGAGPSGPRQAQGQVVVWSLRLPSLAQLKAVYEALGSDASRVQFVYGVEGLYRWLQLYFGVV